MHVDFIVFTTSVALIFSSLIWNLVIKIILTQIKACVN